MEMVETIRVTQKFGRTLDNLEMLWFLRDEAERRMSNHLQGHGMDPDVFAAANTPDEAWTTVAEGYTPPPAMWKIYKEAYFEEMHVLATLANVARRNVRIATGHEKIRDLHCR